MVIIFYLLVACLCLSLGIRSNRRAVSLPQDPDTPSSPSARHTTSSVDWRCPKNTTIPRICSPRTSSMPSASSITRTVSGPSSHAQEICPSEGLSTLLARSARTECSSSVAATPPIRGTTTAISSSYVPNILPSRLPMAPASQSEIPRTSKECYEQDWWTRAQSLPLHDLLQEQDCHLRRSRWCGLSKNFLQ